MYNICDSIHSNHYYILFRAEGAALRILMLTWIDIFVARTKTGAMFRNISFQNKLLFREQHGVCFQLHAYYVHGYNMQKRMITLRICFI